VDGGKGQLGVALAVLKDLGIEGMDVIGLAKERDDLAFADGAARARRQPGPPAVAAGEKSPEKLAVAAPPLPPETAGKEGDRVYLPGRKDPVYLTRWPAALFLLQRIRDEAHRFAVTYHRKVKEKADLQSLLDRIHGIGPARRKALLVFFGDLRRVRTASVEDLQQVEGIGEETARRIRAFLTLT
jgi:excinuclease ABC subunit C